MASSKDLIEIRMKLLGNREVVSGSKSASRAIKEVGTTTEKTAVKSKVAARVNSGLTNSYKQLGKTAKWGLGFLGVGGVLAIESSIHATEELSKTTTGLTRNLGLQTNVASRWGAVAQAREIDSKALTMSFTTLSKRMVEAGRKGGTLLTPFHQLGISQEEAEKGAHNFSWGLMRVADALGEAHSGAIRQTAAAQLLGRGYQTILPLFSEGTKGLKEQLHWADEYGVTLNGHTNEAVMEMVQAQRENKVAMLGLQVSLTKALMPAIHAGDEQLQEFIQTLNDPHLSAEQKISRISHQFLLLEDDLVKLLEHALPKIAEQGGRLGVALAGAVWHGFIHSDTLGKLVIGAWLFKSMGGFGLIGSLGARVGGKLATSLGWKFLETVAPYFAAEAGVEGLGSALATQMGGLRALFAADGALLGTAMGVAAGGALVAEIVFAIEDSENIAGLSLINTPELDATSIEEASMKLREQGYTNIGYINGHEFEAVTPSGKHVVEVQKGHKWVQHPAHRSAHHHRRPHPKASKAAQRESLKSGPPSLLGQKGSGRQIHITVQSILDGKLGAESTTKHALDEAALA